MIKSSIAIAGTFFLFAMELLAAPAADPEAVVDCRVEGESVGLTGRDLQEFVDECVAALAEIDYVNKAR